IQYWPTNLIKALEKLKNIQKFSFWYSSVILSFVNARKLLKSRVCCWKKVKSNNEYLVILRYKDHNYLP
ncbi:MAG: hypothetical protein WA932_01250, partial [Nitrososphaeraceae archaeon]